jgi:hypothetical protein
MHAYIIFVNLTKKVNGGWSMVNVYSMWLNYALLMLAQCMQRILAVITRMFIQPRWFTFYH